jgi:4-amino-4-deoxy-L-arabinose transferase-like glycosyltransferase
VKLMDKLKQILVFRWPGFSFTEATFIGLLVVIGVAGIFLLRFVTPYGLGLVNDSVGYVAGARNILAGNGYSRFTGDSIIVPITNYPPMYSISLAAIGITGLDIVRAARLFNMILIGVNIFMFGWVIRLTTRSRGFMLFGGALFLCSEAFLKIQSFALSEPLYLVLNFLVLGLLAYYLNKPRWYLLAILGVITSLAFLTRYPAVALYATVGISLVLFQEGWRNWMRAGFIFAAFSLPAVLGWVVRNTLITGNSVNRALIFHPIPEDKYFEGLSNFWQFFLPNEFVAVGQNSSVWVMVFGLVITAILFAVVLMSRMNSPERINRQSLRLGDMLVIVFGMQGLLYVIVLVFTLTFLDASPIFEHRILSPFYVSALILLVTFLGRLWKRPAFSNKLLSVVLSAALLWSFGVDGWNTAAGLHEYGQGFTSYRWRESEIIKVVRELPPDVTLFSNRPTALYILAGRSAYAMLSPYNTARGEKRPHYDEDVEKFHQMILDQEAMLVVFDYHLLVENPEEQWILQWTEGLPVYSSLWIDVIFGALP